MSRARLAVYTTAHPLVARYLRAWLASVQAQADRDFDVWIGLDALSVDEAVAAMGGDPGAHWVPAPPGATPAEVRQHALARIVDGYEGVLLVDADDVLAPDRVARARRALARWDVCGCAMRVVDAAGRDTGAVFPLPRGDLAALMPRENVLGLGNTTYRAGVLARCLPLPRECAVMDWFLVTRAWAQRARLGFEPECAMSYRQHGANMTRVLPPFSERQVMHAAALVLGHYAVVLARVHELHAGMRRQLECCRDRVRSFHATLSAQHAVRHRYVRALNRLPPSRTFWDPVAHPDLDAVWRA